MSNEIILPCVLIVFGLVLKLFICNDPNRFDFAFALWGVPTEIAFLATSLSAAYAIFKPENGVILFTICIISAIIVVYLSKSGERLMIGSLRGKHKFKDFKSILGSLVFLFFAVLLSVVVLVCSVSLLSSAKG